MKPHTNMSQGGTTMTRIFISNQTKTYQIKEGVTNLYRELFRKVMGGMYEVMVGKWEAI